MEEIKSELIRQIVADCENQGYDKIYAPVPGYKEPYDISWKQNPKGTKPDISAVKEDDFKLFSIENKVPKRVPKSRLKKWQMFGVYARAKKGKLILVALVDSVDKIKSAIQPVPEHIDFIAVN